jgi:hypothetical protein
MKSFLPDSELGSVDEVRLLDATGSLVKVLAQGVISRNAAISLRVCERTTIARLKL